MAGLTERERVIRTERAELWSHMKPTVEKLGKGERLSVEERTEYRNRDEKLHELDEELRDNLSAQERIRDEKQDADTRGVSTDEAKSQDEREADAFRNYLRYGDAGLTHEDRALLIPQGKPGEG